VSGFQGIALSAVAVLTALSFYSGWRRRSSRRASGLWLVVWSGAALAIAWPDLTQQVARSLGIQRGADLVFYCAVLAMLGGFFVVSLRLRQLSRETTLLVRHLALREAAPAPEGPDLDADLESDAWDPSG
jgi:small membrane protein